MQLNMYMSVESNKLMHLVTSLFPDKSFELLLWDEWQKGKHCRYDFQTIVILSHAFRNYT